MNPTKERLRELFNYDEHTGIVTRAKTTAANAAKGEIVGCISNTGYLRVQVDMKLYYLHRLIWVYCNGEIPNVIDHINGDKLDNRLINLRDTTRAGNSQNMALNINNKSGINGVSFIKGKQKWRARIGVNRTEIALGYFEELSDAITARRDAEAYYGFHANHNRVKI